MCAILAAIVVLTVIKHMYRNVDLSSELSRSQFYTRFCAVNELARDGVHHSVCCLLVAPLFARFSAVLVSSPGDVYIYSGVYISKTSVSPAAPAASRLLSPKVWYDMETIRTRFFDCPVEEIRLQALSMIAIEARSSASMKRKKQSNIRRAAKRKPGYRPPEKKTKRKKAKKADDGDDANSALSLADSNADF